MADGINVGSGHVTIAPDINTGQWVREGQRAGNAFSAAAVAEARGLDGHFGAAGSRAGGGFASGLMSGLQSASRALSSFGQSISNTGQHLSGLGFGLTAAITAPLATAGIALTAFGLSAAMSFEKAAATFKALLPVGYDVEALMKRLRTLATDSPVFDAEVLTRYAAKFTAAGMEISKTERFLKAFGNVAATLGSDAQGTERALYAIAQSFGNGRVQADEFRRQLSEAIPGASKVVVDALGMTMAEFNKAMEAGEITGDMLVDAFIRAGESAKFVDGASLAANTLTGTLQRLRESVRTTFGEAWLENLPQIKTELNDIKPILDDFVKSFVASIPGMVRGFGEFLGHIKNLKAIYDGLTPRQKEWIKDILLFVTVAGPALIVMGKTLVGIGATIQLISLVMNPWGLLIAAVVAALVGLAAIFVNLYRNNEDFRESVQAAGRWFSENLIPAIKEFGFWLQTHVVPVILAFAKSFMEHVWPALQQIWHTVKTQLFPAIKELIDTIGSENIKNFAMWLAETLPKAMAVFLGWVNTGIQIISFMVRLWSDWIAVAKIIWHALEDLGGALKRVGDAINAWMGTLRDSLGQAKGEWSSFTQKIGEAWDGAAMFMRRVWDDNIRPLFDSLKETWRDAERVFRDVWDRGIKPVWDSFRDAIAWAWDNVIVRVFNFIKDGVRSIGDAFRSAWEGGIRPAWDSFRDAVAWAWDNVIRRVFDFIKDSFRGVGDVISSVWEHSIRPVWDRMKDALRETGDRFNEFKDRARDAFDRVGEWAGNLRDRIQDFFQSLKDRIGSIFGDMLHIVAGPVNAAINFINSAIIDPFNRLPGPDVDRLPNWVIRHEGGLVDGPGSGREVAARLLKGEYVIQPSAVRRLGVDTLDRLNAGMPLPAAAGSQTQQPLYVTVLLDGEPIVRRAQAVVDANNSATVNVLRSGRRFA